MSAFARRRNPPTPLPMVSRGMKRYRVRSAQQAELVGAVGSTIDPGALFGRLAPLRLEIGFGHGCFLAPMAAAHPDEDFIGVEAKDIRTTKTAHKSLLAGASNVRLFTDEAQRFVRCSLPAACLHRAYVHCPDPWPRLRHRRRRLVTRGFLLDLAHVMQPDGRLVLTTDHPGYAMHMLSNISTLTNEWHNEFLPAGYRINCLVRFPTTFQRLRRSQGADIFHLQVVRSNSPARPPAPWHEARLGQGFAGARPRAPGPLASGNART